MPRRDAWLVLVLLGTGCARAASPAPSSRRLGDAMTEVGLRFKRAGEAVLAGRWELATYDVNELEEVFEDDLFTSKWMGNAAISRLAHGFTATSIPELRESVRRRDRPGFESAIAHAARACNECHRSAEMAFIEVPEALGANVPMLAPASPAP